MESDYSGFFATGTVFGKWQNRLPETFFVGKPFKE
jgi:hypothetical protein